MIRDKVIIITSKDDAHADHLIRTVNKNHNFINKTIRINTEDFALNTSVFFNGVNFNIIIKDSGREFTSDEVKSVWFRRPKEIIQRSDLSDPNTEFTQKQWTAFLRGLYFSTHNDAVWYNPLPSIHRARIKLQQLVLAHDIGLRTPLTCVTNEPMKARNFFETTDKVCSKSLDEPNFAKDGHFFPMYTRLIENVDEFNDDTAIQVAPIFLQEFIEKSCDVRVIVIDETVFAVCIYSQDLEETKTDFRAAAPHLLRHKILDLPKPLEIKIKQFVRKQCLRFSAMDFCIHKETGEFIFLENNCNGQWLWLERECNVPITESMIHALYF